MSDSSEMSFYETVGGEETFRRLVHAFYQGVAGDPVLRPVYPSKDSGPLRSICDSSSCSTGGARAPTASSAGIPGCG